MDRSEKELRHLIASFALDSGAAQSAVDMLLAAAAEVCRTRSNLKWAYVLRYGGTFLLLAHFPCIFPCTVTRPMASNRAECIYFGDEERESKFPRHALLFVHNSYFGSEGNVLSDLVHGERYV